MEDHIEFHFDPNTGFLSLVCDKTAFEQVRRVVRDNVNLKTEEIPIEAVRHIEVVEVSATPPKPRAKIHDRIALFTCAIITLLVGFVVTAGVMQIMAWAKSASL